MYSAPLALPEKDSARLSSARRKNVAARDTAHRDRLQFGDDREHDEHTVVPGFGEREEHSVRLDVSDDVDGLARTAIEVGKPAFDTYHQVLPSPIWALGGRASER